MSLRGSFRYEDYVSSLQRIASEYGKSDDEPPAHVKPLLSRGMLTSGLMSFIKEMPSFANASLISLAQTNDGMGAITHHGSFLSGRDLLSGKVSASVLRLSRLVPGGLSIFLPSWYMPTFI